MGVLPVVIGLISGLLCSAPAKSESPELIVQVGHTQSVSALAFSGDGKMLATGSTDKTAKVWDLRTGKLITTVRGFSSTVSSVELNQDGTVLALQSLIDNGGSGTHSIVQLVDVASGGKVIATAKAESCWTLALSPSGKQWACEGELSKVLTVRDTKTAKVLKTLPSNPAVIAYLQFRDESTLLIDEGGLREVDVRTAKERALGAGAAERESFKRTHRAAAATEPRSIASWHADARRAVLAAKSAQSSALGLSPDKRMLTVILVSQEIGQTPRRFEVKQYSTDTGAVIVTRNYALPYREWIESVLVGNDGRYFAVGTSTGTVFIYDLASGLELQQLRRFAHPVTQVSFSPDGKQVLSSGGSYSLAGEARIWDLTTAKLQRFVGGYGDKASALFVDNAASMLMAGFEGAPGGNSEAREQETLKRVDLKTGAERSLFRGRINGYGMDAAGKRLVVSSVGPKGAPRSLVIDTIDGRTLLEVPAWSASISPDGKRIAYSLPDAQGVVAQVDDGRELFKVWAKGFFPTSMWFSPDGEWLMAYAEDGWSYASLVSAKTGEVQLEFGGHQQYHSGAFVFSADSKKIYTGCLHHEVQVWDIKRKKIARKFRGAADTTGPYALSPDERTIATVTDGATVLLLDATTGKRKTSMLGMNESDYIIFSPDGYYTASRGASRGVGFRLGARAYPFEQFDLKLNRPDKVLRSLGQASPQLIELYEKAYARRIAKQGFTEAMLGAEFHIPTLSLLTPASLTSKDKELKLSVDASDSKYDLTRLLVWVNDVPVPRSDALDLRGQKTHQARREISVRLSNGRNKIQLAVLNEQGTESVKETLNIMHDGAATPSNLYVVAVGVSVYKDSSWNLQYAAKDANDLSALLQSTKRSAGGAAHVLRLLDQDATKEKLAEAKAFLATSNVDDQVVVFVAGHGLLDKQDYYFATTDIDFTHPAERGASYADLEGLIDDISARQKILLMDTCNSGEVDAEVTTVATASVTPQGTVRSRGLRVKATNAVGIKTKNALLQELFLDLRRGSGSLVIASAGGLEQALESDEWKNGVFTYALLDGWKNGKADRNKDGVLLVSELRDYVFDKVSALTAGQQTPTTRRDSLEFDYVLSAP